MKSNSSNEITKRFLTLFDSLEKQVNGRNIEPDHVFRRKAMAKLVETPFPGRKDENWKYTNITRVLKPHYLTTAASTGTRKTLPPDNRPSLNAYRLIFFNGVLQPALSDLTALRKSVDVLPISEALKHIESKVEIEKHFYNNIDGAANAFSLLNTAFAHNGWYIKIAEGVNLDKPILVWHVIEPQLSSIFIHPQLIVVNEKDSEMQLVEYFTSEKPKDSCLINSSVSFFLRQNAGCQYYRIQNIDDQTFLIHQTSVSQDSHSRFDSNSLDLGGSVVRNNLEVILNQSGSEAHLMGVYIASGNQHIDNQTFIDHASPHCMSNELFKGILGGHSKGVFNGKVLVRQDAQKTNAFQQNGNLLLSPTATMNSKPQLEIFADDVKCSHGATIGQLDEDALFYLQTRGLNRVEAKNILQYAFVGEVIERFTSQEVRELAEKLIHHKIHSL